MTITYATGEIVEALLLSRGKDTLRAAIPGEDDARIFTLIHDKWISEECEPVQIDFASGRFDRSNIPSEADCICSKALAVQLISKRQAGSIDVADRTDLCSSGGLPALIEALGISDFYGDLLEADSVEYPKRIQ